MKTPHLTPADRVAEIQGLYGPFTFPEKLAQQLWLRREFAVCAAATLAGERVEVLHPGRWNRLGGPDFKNARLRLGGRAVTGDVEVHLRAEDWAAHGHECDPAYAGVVLHVVLFPPSGAPARGADGRPLPTLVLLPLLLHDLEEYAADEAVAALANRPAWQATERLAGLPPEELAALLRRHAAERWRQKVHFARARAAKLGWAEACHQTALEILGYRFNRAPMLRLAARHPLPEWAAGIGDIEAFYAEESAHWSVQGVRPANHPRTRLRQYAAWARARPDWPETLAEAATGLPAGVDSARATGEVRRELRLTAAREVIAERVTGGAVGGTRLATLVCDGFLPLLAAHDGADWSGLWFHWFAGDLPPALPRALRELGVWDGRAQPAGHGYAQGLLGWMLARETAG